MGAIEDGPDTSYYTETNKKGSDNKGRYIIRILHYEGICDCHPETCSHFNRRTWYSKEIKKYI